MISVVTLAIASNAAEPVIVVADAGGVARHGAVPVSVPELNYVMPAFPGEREVPLVKEKPLVLQYRLCIHAGMADEHKLAGLWAAYASPPTATVEKN